jgi:hypothetical protein
MVGLLKPKASFVKSPPRADDVLRFQVLWVKQPKAQFKNEASRSGGFYDAAFTQTMMRGLVAASLGQVAVLSLMRVTGVLRAPQ